MSVRPVLAVHGGAGRLPPERLDPPGRDEVESGLLDALGVGLASLEAGASAVDVVTAAVRVLEDCPHFNAGRGAELTDDGRVELSASLMDGTTRAAGAVAVVRRIRNPIEAARALLEHRHVLLVGEPAEEFALQAGCASADEEWFRTPTRIRQWRERSQGAGGTVGAVALDTDGHVAAATSTGGVAGQLAGRIGDTPTIGAGTWADDASCAVSATGLGESFMRAAYARRVADLVELAGRPLTRASEEALAEVAALGGIGGAIAVDPAGRLAMPFDTPHMPRGWVRPGEPPRVEPGAAAPIE